MQQNLWLPPLQKPTDTLTIRPKLLVQPNPNPNNKVAQNVEAPTTFQNYYITPIRCNEIHLQLGKVINPKHSNIITAEECESLREDTTDLEDVFTTVIAISGRNFVLVKTNSIKYDTPTTTESTMITIDPPYNQRLAETGMNSQLQYDFLRELKYLNIQIPMFY